MNASPSYWSFFAEHRAEILGATADHMMLVVIAMLIAMAIALPLGMLIVERPALRALSMGIANIFQTLQRLAREGLAHLSFAASRSSVIRLFLPERCQRRCSRCSRIVCSDCSNGG